MRAMTFSDQSDCSKPVIGINEERLGKCARQVEHIIGHVFVTVYIGSLVCPLKTLCPTHMMKWLVVSG
jgi:hypothetical protein